MVARVTLVAHALLILMLPVGTAFAVLASPPTQQAPGRQGAAASAPLEVDAAALYRRDCAQCHGPRGEGSRTGPVLAGVGAAAVDYYLSTGRMPLAEPADEVERSSPAYEADEIAALVEYVAAFAPGGEPIPEVDPESGDVAAGGVIYRAQCAACHQTIGSGGALLDREAPPLAASSPTQIAAAIRVGPGNMPAFGQAAIAEDDLDGVVAYVLELQQPDDRGGFPLWHLGPVPEGAVAIVVGLGVVVIVTTWIERRRDVGD